MSRLFFDSGYVVGAVESLGSATRQPTHWLESTPTRGNGL